MLYLRPANLADHHRATAGAGLDQGLVLLVHGAPPLRLALTRACYLHRLLDIDALLVLTWTLHFGNQARVLVFP